MFSTYSFGQHFRPPLPYTNPLTSFLPDQLITQFSNSTSSSKDNSSFKKLSLILLSPSTVINLSVSLNFAHSLCAASEPFTP